ncbi:KAP family NTPase [Geomonas sp. Red32]|uniref:P-loop NTPase fold protein n=1 Tax=Geomonas sp. Red32 TaxID=2912856 RepID=UPI00202D05D6|nr:P-loop NTPase fold protein [Geomonas sp. Red32]MCM0083740.1 KAP family NTPase [Geomonas sp. Red32]
MTELNQHIVRFLDYYCGLAHSPEYAVLLKGPWGSGKSWFINKFQERLQKKGIKSIYVSLYGVTSFSEIESIFFQQLHPVLSHKGMALAGKVLKGALKATLKVDLDVDGDSVSINSQIPDIKIPDYLKNTEGCVLIFDDLERCPMDVHNVLGYINHFVEHQGFKSVIIANEEELFRHDQNRENLQAKYADVKEKLIGKTFQVEPDIDTALEDFCGKVSDEEARLFLVRNRKLIKDIHNASGYKNLRHLKQALWDFERLFSVLDLSAQSKEAMLQHLLRVLFVLSFEIKSNAIKINEIPGLKSVAMTNLLHRELTETETKLSNIVKKYNVLFDPYNTLLDYNTWKSIIDTGKIEKDIISDLLAKSMYFNDENQKSWIRLWHFVDLTDDEFDSLLPLVQAEFGRMEYDSAGIVLHVTGILIYLSRRGIINTTHDEIKELAEKHILHLKTTGRLEQKQKRYLGFLDREQWGGLSFAEKDSDEFKQVFKFYTDMLEKSHLEKLPLIATALMDKLIQDENKFYSMVTLSNDEDYDLSEVPIFSYISPADFVERFIKIPPPKKFTVAYAICRRYEIPHTIHQLVDELPVLREIVSLLNAKQQELSPKLSSDTLRRILDGHLYKALEALTEAYNREPPGGRR